MNGYKGHAAIATLEHLGYEYTGGEQWKPPVKVITEQAMAKRQREINYWASIDNEKAALNNKSWGGIEDTLRAMKETEDAPHWDATVQYSAGDKVFIAGEVRTIAGEKIGMRPLNPFDNPELWEEVKKPSTLKNWHGINVARKLMEEVPIPAWTKDQIRMYNTIRGNLPDYIVDGLSEDMLTPEELQKRKPSTTYSRLKDEIIKEYLAAQISELK